MAKRKKGKYIPGHVKARLANQLHRQWLKTHIKYQKGICYLCGKDFNDDATLEHIIPLSRDGEDTPQNTMAAHKLCNRRKGRSLLEELDWPIPRESFDALVIEKRKK